MDMSQFYRADRYKLWTNDHVRFCDLDALGHVNNNAMGMYFENARANLFHIVTPGWPWRDSIFVLARTCITFTHELHLPAKVKIGTCLTKIGTTSLHVANALWHGETPISYSESVSVLIDRKKRQPLKISEELRHILQEYMENR